MKAEQEAEAEEQGQGLQPGRASLSAHQRGRRGRKQSGEGRQVGRAPGRGVVHPAPEAERVQHRQGGQSS